MLKHFNGDLKKLFQEAGEGASALYLHILSQTAVWLNPSLGI